MPENRTTIHTHKTEGPVVIISSTAHLAKVLVVDRDDEIWVKRADLSEVATAILKTCANGSSTCRASRVRLSRTIPRARRREQRRNERRT
jgi:hypothetical protein